MDMVAVDPKLFVMCRLCLDDTGMYQIVPSVQQQIKYCFDIDVEPFDGLPQLICKRCEFILSEFNITKRKFVEKQNGLKTKVRKAIQSKLFLLPQQEAVSSSQQNDSENKDTQKDNILIRAENISRLEKDNKITDFQKENSLIRAENSSSQENDKENNDFQKENSLIRAENSSSQENDKENNDFQKDNSLIRAVNSSSQKNDEANNDFQKENSLIRAENSSCQENDKENNDFQKDNFTIRSQNIRNNSSSSTSNDLEDRALTPAVEENKVLKKCKKTQNGQWEAYYNKRFVCGICKKSNKKKTHLIRHLKRHRKLLASYDTIFKTRCIVKMNKVDGRLNMTGAEHTVVIDPQKILCAQGKNYYTVYLPKESPGKRKNDFNECAEIEICTNAVSSDDDVFLNQARTKRRRILSRSSNETVILERDNYKNSLSESENKLNTTENKEPQCLDMELITVDDSSDNDSQNSNVDLKSNNPFNVKLSGHKVIQNIISVSRNKYKKKVEIFQSDFKNSASSEHLLKHKILSIGRKVINNQGFNCTGLLRFIEYKNLVIKWTPTNSTHTTGSKNKDLNYVRIMPRLRGADKSHNNLGWKNLPENHENTLLEDYSNDPQNKTVTSVEQSDFKTNNSDSPVESTTAPINDKLKENDILDAVLYTPDAVMCNNASEPDGGMKKLLNSNPVANPKKLPKKSNVMEAKSNLKEKREGISIIKQNLQCKSPICITIDDEIQNSNLCMPIITSTTSLAGFSSTKIKENNENINHTNTVSSSHALHEPEVSRTPRIKVKPVSELMPDRVLNNLNQQQSVASSSNIWNIQNQPEAVTSPSLNTVGNVYMPGKEAQVQEADVPVPAPVAIASSSVVPPEEMETALPQATRDYVILNTVELPNTKTDSPIKYFKRLLQIHDITLLVSISNENLSRDFVSIIKFKVKFNQDALVLGLSLYCSKNTFCFGVKGGDPGNNIDITTLSANWQWEILKAYKGEGVVNKLLQSAKKISQEVYEYTKNFLCLLKSIDFLSET